MLAQEMKYIYRIRLVFFFIERHMILLDATL